MRFPVDFNLLVKLLENFLCMDGECQGGSLPTWPRVVGQIPTYKSGQGEVVGQRMDAQSAHILKDSYSNRNDSFSSFCGR